MADAARQKPQVIRSGEARQARGSKVMDNPDTMAMPS
jgi:hypothetical protein